MGRIEVGGGIDEVGLPSHPSSGSFEVGVQRVGAARHPDGSAPRDLVAHGVGERLGRVVARDGVAVVVQEAVQGAQGQDAVAAEEGDAGGSQAAAPELERIVDGRWERGLLDAGWPATSMVGRAGPEVLTDLVELVEQPEARAGEVVQLVVGGGELLDAGQVSLVQLLSAVRDPKAGADRHGEAVATPLHAAEVERPGAEILGGEPHVLVAVDVVALGTETLVVHGDLADGSVAVLRKGRSFEGRASASWHGRCSLGPIMARGSDSEAPVDRSLPSPGEPSRAPYAPNRRRIGA
jgi:hypothetical protein